MPEQSAFTPFLQQLVQGSLGRAQGGAGGIPQQINAGQRPTIFDGPAGTNPLAGLTTAAANIPSGRDAVNPLTGQPIFNTPTLNFLPQGTRPPATPGTPPTGGARQPAGVNPTTGIAGLDPATMAAFMALGVPVSALRQGISGDFAQLSPFRDATTIRQLLDTQ